MLRRAWSVCALAASATAHGMMTLPTPRNGGSLSLGGTAPTAASASFYTDNSLIPGPETLPTEMATTNIVSERCGPTPPDNTTGKCPDGSPPGPEAHACPSGKCPWRAPGSAHVKSPCGNTFGMLPAGEDLPKSNQTVVWKRGSTQRAAFAVFQNHGGGYAWRLCPKSGAPLRPTEECFQQHYMRFADDTTTVHYALDSIHAAHPEFTIPAVRTTTGTSPAGSQWTRNPIPSDEAPVIPPYGTIPLPPPFKGGSGSVWGFSLIDNVVVPDDIEPGQYWLGWRWDCDVNPQVYGNCADIEIE